MLDDEQTGATTQYQTIYKTRRVAFRRHSGARSSTRRSTSSRVLLPTSYKHRWCKDGRELYYLGSDGQVYAVPLTSRSSEVPAARQPEPLFTIDAEARAAIHSVVSFDVSADGSRFVIPSMTPGES